MTIEEAIAQRKAIRAYLDKAVSPDDVAKVSIRDVTPERVAAVRDAGRRLRVVCTALAADLASDGGTARVGTLGAETSRPRVRTSMQLVELPPDHPLFSASGSTLDVLLHTDLMGTLEVAERDALPEQTAFAVYADVLALHEGR